MIWPAQMLRNTQGVAKLRLPGPYHLTYDNHQTAAPYSLHFHQLKTRDGLSNFVTDHSNKHGEGLQLPDNIVGGFVVNVTLLEGIEFGEDYAEAVDSIYEDTFWTLSEHETCPILTSVAAEFTPTI